MAKANYIGRRKTSTARLYIKPGKGDFLVNGDPLDKYFDTQAKINVAMLPLEVTEKTADYDIKVTVRGGGITGQAGAIQLAVARALDDLNEDLHDVLKQNSLLTRDDRMVERKKYGQPKARKKFQFSKR
ncbi:MAG TPA: 30S ribosomal protein S9 [Balneolaceae bacterium]|nr:30S ribosomal protein S9 [Balneolaceae bacterium]